MHPDPEPRWGTVAIALHWTMAGLILALFVLGWTAESWHLSPTKLKLFQWHKSLGLLVLTLVWIRLAWRWTHTVPPIPAGTRPWEARVAVAVHRGLYVLMVAMPLSGWLINSAANIPFKVFGWFRLPDLVEPDKALKAAAQVLHLSLFWTLAAILALHILGALRHHFVLHDGVLSRMLPKTGRRRE